MSYKPNNQTQNETTQREHDTKGEGAKKVTLWGYDSDNDTLARISANESSDGSFSISTSPKDEALGIDDTTTADTTYIGKAATGTATSAASWKISKLDDSTGRLTWADGDANYDNIWDNRASLSYS